MTITKIPLAPEQPQPLPPAPTAVPEALEILLLGGIWWFVLILLPLIQHLPAEFVAADWMPTLVKVQGLSTAAIALVLVVLQLTSAMAPRRVALRQASLFAAIALLGCVLAWQGVQGLAQGDLYLYGVGLQGVLGLACFLTRRIQHP